VESIREKHNQRPTQAEQRQPPHRIGQESKWGALRGEIANKLDTGADSRSVRPVQKMFSAHIVCIKKLTVADV
jgi:hypothetical protein